MSPNYLINQELHRSALPLPLALTNVRKKDRQMISPCPERDYYAYRKILSHYVATKQNDSNCRGAMDSGSRHYIQKCPGNEISGLMYHFYLLQLCCATAPLQKLANKSITFAAGENKQIISPISTSLCVWHNLAPRQWFSFRGFAFDSTCHTAALTVFDTHHTALTQRAVTQLIHFAGTGPIPVQPHTFDPIVKRDPNPLGSCPCRSVNWFLMIKLTPLERLRCSAWCLSASQSVDDGAKVMSRMVKRNEAKKGRRKPFHSWSPVSITRSTLSNGHLLLHLLLRLVHGQPWRSSLTRDGWLRPDSVSCRVGWKRWIYFLLPGATGLPCSGCPDRKREFPHRRWYR